MLDYDNDFHLMELICDHCQLTETKEGTFNDCVTNFKDDGWRFYKDGKVFAHKCPTCIGLEDDD